MYRQMYLKHDVPHIGIYLIILCILIYHLSFVFRLQTPTRRQWDGNTNPHAVDSVIDHQQINIRSAGEQDRH